MEIKHHDLKFDFPDDWWTGAGMADFVPTTRAYRTIPASQILTVSIEDVGPVDLARRLHIFRDSEEEGTARSRVVRICRGFLRGEAIPPVEVVDGKPDYGHRFKLTHGAHRLYCSLAAKFTHIPVVRKNFDFSDPFA
jgi:hypothetical protein